MRRRWKTGVAGLVLLLLLVGAGIGAWVLDGMALAYLTGQRRVPGQSFFGDDLPEGGRVPGYAWLGSSRPSPDGGFVIGRPWEAGREIGLEQGDRVLSVAGRPHEDSRDLFRYLTLHHGAGEEVPVEVQRGEQRLELQLTLKPFLRTPADLELEYQDVEIESDSGGVLRGWWLPGPAGDSGPAVVFVHGAKSSRFQGLEGAPYWHRRRYGLLTMDLSGRGSSDGEYVTYTVNERLDVAAMLGWARRRVGGAENVALFGTSNGAASVIYAAAADGQVPALALDAPYGDLWAAAAGELAQRNMSPALLRPLSWAVRRRAGIDLSRIRPIEVVDQIQAPVLFVHGDADDRVPLEQSRDMVEKRRNAGLPTELWVIEGGEHGFDNYPPAEVFWNRIADFFDRALEGSAPAPALAAAPD